MKIINDLVVCEVPKGAVKCQIVEDCIGYTLKPPHKMDWTYIDLPPGQYEIIGLYSEIDQLQEIEILQAANYEIETSFWWFLSEHNINQNEPETILFLKRI